MHKFFLIVLLITYFGVIIAFAVIRKRATEKTIKVKAWHRADWSTYCEEDWQRLSRWLRDHPYGIITSEDREEHNDLVYQLQGSYFLYCQSKGIDSFTDPYALWLDEQIQDWSTL